MMAKTFLSVDDAQQVRSGESAEGQVVFFQCLADRRGHQRSLLSRIDHRSPRPREVLQGSDHAFGPTREEPLALVQDDLLTTAQAQGRGLESCPDRLTK